jgi:tetratricopeptide (TPR) repeat protein
MLKKIITVFVIAVAILSCMDKKEKARLELNAGVDAMYESRDSIAVVHFKNAVKLDETNPEGYLYLGNMELSAGHLDAALEYIDKALKIYPEYGEAYRIKGRIYFIKGDHLKSCKNYKLAKKYGIPNLDNYLKFCK